MKCWECRKDVTKVHIVHYYSPGQQKEASRDICPECYSKLKFNGCHYVEVEKINQRSLVIPMPTVTYEGITYKLRSRKIQVPDLSAMDSLSVHVWLNRNTTAKGYRKEPALVLPNTISISTK